MAASTRSSTPVSPRAAIAARSASGSAAAGVGGGVQHRPPQLIGVGIEELELGKLLGVVLQQPGVVDHRHQDQRLARRQRGAEPAHDRAADSRALGCDVGSRAFGRPRCRGLRPREKSGHCRTGIGRRTGRRSGRRAARTLARGPEPAAAPATAAAAPRNPGRNICAPIHRRCCAPPRARAPRTRRGAPACRTRRPRSRASTASRRAAARRASTSAIASRPPER